jgi:UDP-3-O-[3-hydroxymyristoyl] glucosamine N-acyltransferase
MADPRFFKNLGPFTLAQICEKLGIAVPAGADGALAVSDVADLAGAGDRHLTFFSGVRHQREAFAASRARVCLVPQKAPPTGARPDMVLVQVASVGHAFTAIAGLFYPAKAQPGWGTAALAPDARIAPDVAIAPGAVIGPRAEIGSGTRIGPNVAIGPGVTIGSDCDIGANVTITHAHLGDRVAVKPGAQIGQPGFGFVSSDKGHERVLQLGRVIIQDDVEIGANNTVDRGALGDTVIGEGCKFDNLVQIAHNARLGRHCLMVAQSGIAGSAELEDFIILGAQSGVGDHAHVGAGARLAGRSATVSGQQIPGGRDYGGVPVKPIREWLREIHAVAKLGRKQDGDV